MLPYVDLNRMPSAPGWGEIPLDDLWQQLMPQPPPPPGEGDFRFNQPGAEFNRFPQSPYQPAIDQFPVHQSPDFQNLNNPQGAIPWFEHQASFSPPGQPNARGPMSPVPGWHDNNMMFQGLPPGETVFDLNRLRGGAIPLGIDSNYVDRNFPLPHEQFTYPDTFSNRFNSVYEQPSHFMPTDPFEAARQHEQAGSPWIPQGMMAQELGPFDDPRGDFIGDAPSGGNAPRNSFPTQPGTLQYPVPLPVMQPPPFFGGGMGPGGIPFAPGLTPQGFTPSLPNLGVPLGGGFAINNWV